MSSRLPIPGQDDGTWGNILNQFLEVSHNQDGTLQTAAITQAGGVTSVNSKTPTNGAVTLAASDVGALGTSTRLSGLSDTSAASSAASGQVLAFDSGSNQWVPSTVSSGTVNNATSSTPGIIQLDGDLGGTATTPTITSTHLASALPVNQGGTGATTQNFVDLSSTQTIGGAKTFSSSVGMSSQKITGLANGSVSTDAAAFGQIPTAGTGGSNFTAGNATVGGDLTGTLPNPTVAKVNGITLPGSAPSGSGQVLTSTSTSATAWTTPAAGVTLDGTVGDIQPDTVTGTAVVGSTGKAADAGHQHTLVSHNHTTANLGGQIPVGGLNATGSASSTTFLRGDGSWQTPAGASNATSSTLGLIQLDGDLSGTATSPTVAKVNGITLPGSAPSGSGQVLTSTSTSATAWTTPAGASNATSSTPGLVQLDGDLGGTATSPTVTSTHLASALPINQGGTGSTSQNFVDLSSNQTIAGTKTFSNTITGNISGNAATVTTNANLTGPITSAGNATSVASQTGTGSTFVMSASPALTGIPTAPTASGGTNTTQLATTAFVSSAVSGSSAPAASFTTAGLLKETVFNVRDYGAVGDGSTNDAPSIQNAVNAANTAGGGIVYLSPATYSIATAITLYSFVTIQGAGRGQTIIQLASGANTNAFVANSAGGYESIVIEHVTVDGNATNQTGAGSGSALIFITGSDTLMRNIAIRNCTVQNTYQHAIFLTGDNTASRYPKWIVNNYIFNHGAGAIGFGIYTDYCPNTLIQGNTLKQSNGNDAIEMGHIGENRCIGNYLVDGKIQFPFANNSIISNNILDADTIQNDSNTANNVVITGNQLTNIAPAAGYAGISVVGNNPTITGNYVKVSAQNGIRVYGSTSGGVIANNTIDGTNPTTGGANGIYPDHSNDVVISSNYIQNFSKAVAVVYDNNTVSLNKVVNCTTGVYLSNTSGSGHTIVQAQVLWNDLAGATTAFDPQNQTDYVLLALSDKNVGFGTTSSTARLQLPAGTATAGTSPLKLTSGTNLTTPEDGAIEYNGTHYYATIGSTRFQLDQQSGGGVTSLAGTTNQVIASASTGAVTLSLPQNVNTSATPQFNGVNLSQASSGAEVIELLLSNTGGAAGSDVSISLQPGNLSTGRAKIRSIAPGGSDAQLAFYTSHANGAPVQQVLIDGTGNITYVDAANFTFGSTNGTKIGTATTQKLGFFNATPVVQPTGDVLAGLTSLGLLASPTLNYGDITRRMVTLTDGATITPNSGTTDVGTVTIAGNRTMAAPTGSPADGQQLTFIIIQDATGTRTITWNASYVFGVDVPTPTLSTTPGKSDYIGFVYNAANTVWRCVAVARGY